MFDIHQPVFDSDGEFDEDRSYEYVEKLMSEFAESPEAQPIIEANGSVAWAASMMEYGISYVGATPATMTPGDFDEVLFELFPRKVSAEPERAGEIFKELRAFWAFVGRQYGLANAERIRAGMDDRAAKRFEKEFADPANFGMAKSMVMSGMKAGFDMTTPEGCEAFRQAYNASLPINSPPPTFPGMFAPPIDLGFESLPARPQGAELKQKRKDKKRERQAKKRNRAK